MTCSTGNYIGTNAAGSAALGIHGAGVTVTDGADEFIGQGLAGNVISGNTKEGVCLTAGTSGTVVWGNFIGTDVSGMHKIAYAADGIFVASSGNQIGGRKRGTGQPHRRQRRECGQFRRQQRELHRPQPRRHRRDWVGTAQRKEEWDLLAAE